MMDVIVPPASPGELPSCIRPGLYIGSVATDKDLNMLQAVGITHVLQVMANGNATEWPHNDYIISIFADLALAFIFMHA